MQVYSKNSEDIGDGDDADSGVTITATTPGRYTKEWDSAKATNPSKIYELVRYKFTGKSSTATDYVLFRMLPATWFDSVKG